MAENILWFKDLDKVPPVSELQLKEIGEVLLNALKTSELDFSTLSSDIQQDQQPRLLFVSFSIDFQPADIFMGKGLGLTAALRNCFSKLWPYWRTGLSYVLKIDAVTTFRDLGRIKAKDTVTMTSSLEGIAFSETANFALLPEQIFSYGLYDEDKKVIDFNSMQQVVLSDPFAAAHLSRVVEANNIQLYIFRTLSVIFNNDNFHSVYRGKRKVTDVTPAELEERLKLAALYLARSINANGKFDYIVRPQFSYFSKSYNITRHAGTLYAMFEYCEHFPNETVLKAGQKGLEFMIQQMPRGNVKDSLCLSEQGAIKLGAIALAVIALEKYIKVTKDTRYEVIIQKLGNFIHGKVQDNGEIKPQREALLPKLMHQEDYPSRYYPGECCLALMRLYNLDRNPKWLDAGEKAANWLITVRDKAEETLEHDHWLLYALNDLQRFRANPLYIEHAKKLSQSSLKNQITESEYPDWIGGFTKNPRSTPAATHGEGMNSLYCLIRDFGNDPAYLKEVFEAYQRTLQFQLSTQYLDESVMYFQKPIMPYGGFHGYHKEPDIRIDYVQHNMSSVLGYYKIISGIK